MAPSWGPSAPPPSTLCCEGLLPLPASIPDHHCGKLPSGYLYATRCQCGCGTDHAQGKAHGLGAIEPHQRVPLRLCALCLKIGCVPPVGLVSEKAPWDLSLALT